MNKISKLLAKGWTVTEIRFDKWQGWYYLGASHDSGEASASAAAQSLNEAIDCLYSEAVSRTPAWYLAQQEAG